MEDLIYLYLYLCLFSWASCSVTVYLLLLNVKSGQDDIYRNPSNGFSVVLMIAGGPVTIILAYLICAKMWINRVTGIDA